MRGTARPKSSRHDLSTVVAILSCLEGWTLLSPSSLSVPAAWLSRHQLRDPRTTAHWAQHPKQWEPRWLPLQRRHLGRCPPRPSHPCAAQTALCGSTHGTRESHQDCRALGRTRPKRGVSACLAAFFPTPNCNPCSESLSSLTPTPKPCDSIWLKREREREGERELSFVASGRTCKACACIVHGTSARMPGRVGSGCVADVGNVDWMRLGPLQEEDWNVLQSGVADVLAECKLMADADRTTRHTLGAGVREWWNMLCGCKDFLGRKTTHDA